jgi:hypothetical protein
MKDAPSPPGPYWWFAAVLLLTCGTWYFWPDAAKGDQPAKPAVATPGPAERSALGTASNAGTGPMVTGWVQSESYPERLPFVGVEDIPGDPDRRGYQVPRKYLQALPEGAPEGEQLVSIPAFADEVVFGDISAALTKTAQELKEKRIARQVHLLNTIMLPSVQFEEATVAEALEYLRQQSVRLGPGDDQRLNFVSRLGEAEPSVEPGLAEFGADSSPAPAKPSDEPGQKRITLRLTNVPLAVALKYALDLGGLRYHVEEYAVVIVPVESGLIDEIRLYTREFRVRPDFLRQGSGTTDAGDGDPKMAMDILKAAGVSFDLPNSRATFLPSSSKLVVRNTVENIDLIESMYGTPDFAQEFLTKLNTRVLPSLQFQDATIEECVSFLRQQTTRMGNGPDPKISYVPGAAPRRITLRLDNVPLGVATRYIADLAGLQIQVREENGVEHVDFVER